MLPLSPFLGYVPSSCLVSSTSGSSYSAPICHLDAISVTTAQNAPSQLYFYHTRHLSLRPPHFISIGTHHLDGYNTSSLQVHSSGEADIPSHPLRPRQISLESSAHSGIWLPSFLATVALGLCFFDFIFSRCPRCGAPLYALRMISGVHANATVPFPFIVSTIHSYL